MTNATLGQCVKDTICATLRGTHIAVMTAYVSSDRWIAMFAPSTSPADSLAAARYLLGPHANFSHLKNGYPVYRAE